MRELSVPTRRDVVSSGVAFILASPCMARAATFDSSIVKALRRLEQKFGGRLGVAAIDSHAMRTISYRGDERYAMCSTFKFLAVAATLQRVDHGHDRLDRKVAFGKHDLLDYAPIARQHLASGSMRVDVLCMGAIEYSDNTCANLLLAALGGPQAVTQFVRSIGDPFTRLDRNEPSLNSSVPSDPRDTSTPLAYAQDMNAILLGGALSKGSKSRLINWMVANTTGAKRIRAGMPQGWLIGDKTGTGDNGSTNDEAIVWPPHRKPVVISAFYTGSNAARAAREAVLAETGRIVRTWIGVR